MATNLSRPEHVARPMTRSPLVLASASPRRLEIMRSIRLDFEVVPADIDESSVDGVAPDSLARILAERKAAAVSATRSGSCVVAADTVVSFEGVSLGKPGNEDDAVSMLQRLSGRTHRVHTGVAVRAGDVAVSGVETTEVGMRYLFLPEIEEYVRSGAAMDKAGAYGIQDTEFSPVESINGSYLNVVGLPVGLLARLLFQAGEIDSATRSYIAREDSR